MVCGLLCGTAIGPLLGGLLLDHFWWGSVFLLGVPLMVGLLVLGPALLPEARDPEAGRLDVTSAAMSLVGVLAVFFAAPADRTLLHRWPTLADVAEAAAVAAYDRAAATTGTVINLTAGSVVN